MSEEQSGPRRLLGPWWSAKLAVLILIGLIGVSPGVVPARVMGWLGVPGLGLPHADAWVIAAAAEELGRGGDPSLHNPLDPWRRRINYPHIVGETASTLGVTRASVPILAATFTGMFLVGVLGSLRSMNGRALVIAIPLLLSPPVMLGLERGNLDMFVLGALMACCFTLPRIVPLAAVPLCALKLFPAFALGAWFHEPDARKRRVWLLGGVACALYGVATFADLLRVRALTPKDAFFTWGADTLWLKIGVEPSHGAGLLPGLLLFAFGLFAASRTRLTDAPPVPLSERPARLGAVMGAWLYVGCFCLGTNYDYRLVLALLIVPWLIEAALSTPAQPSHRGHRLALFLIFAVLWFPAIALKSSWTAWADEICALIMMFACGWMLGPGKCRTNGLEAAATLL